MSNESTIVSELRSVTSVSIDSAGDYLVTGGYDCIVKSWEFFNNKDASSMKLYASFEPFNE